MFPIWLDVSLFLNLKNVKTSNMLIERMGMFFFICDYFFVATYSICNVLGV